MSARKRGITEGRVSKGGQNDSPTTPRPDPPEGQGRKITSTVTATVTEKHSEGLESVTQPEVVGRPLTKLGAPLVKFGVGTTRSLSAPYEMLRLDVVIEVPYHMSEGPDEALEFAVDWAEKKMNELEERYEVGK